MSGHKERHHFVPAFYLEGFVDPAEAPYMWLIDKNGGEARRTVPKDAGLQKHFYSFRASDGTRDSDSLEDALAEVEDQVAPIWRKLIDRRDLDNAERSIVSYFLSLLLTRVPRYRENIEKLTAGMVKRTRRSWRRTSRSPSGGVPRAPSAVSRCLERTQKEAAFLRSDKYEVVINPEYTLTAITGRFAKAFYAMLWVSFIAQGRYRFVTSATSSPVALLGLLHAP